MKLYQAIATAIVARENSYETYNQEWLENWENKLEEYQKLLPSGSGFDSGCEIDLDNSNGERIRIKADFHHMNEHGFYDGWTEHTVTIRASLLFGFEVRVNGVNRNNIKEYIQETFNHVMSMEVEQC